MDFKIPNPVFPAPPLLYLVPVFLFFELLLVLGFIMLLTMIFNACIVLWKVKIYK